jgi:hypothetical protein
MYIHTYTCVYTYKHRYNHTSIHPFIYTYVHVPIMYFIPDLSQPFNWNQIAVSVPIDLLCVFFLGGGGQRSRVPPPPRPTICNLLKSTTLSTGMTGISLHMQWPLTTQLRGSILKENNWFFVMDQSPLTPSTLCLFITSRAQCVGSKLASSWIHCTEVLKMPLWIASERLWFWLHRICDRR